MKPEEIKKIRRRFKLTQRDLARSLCVSVWTVVSWETGSRFMPSCCEKLLCLVYGLPFRDPDIVQVDDPNQPDLPFD